MGEFCHCEKCQCERRLAEIEADLAREREARERAEDDAQYFKTARLDALARAEKAEAERDEIEASLERLRVETRKHERYAGELNEVRADLADAVEALRAYRRSHDEMCGWGTCACQMCGRARALLGRLENRG